MGHENSQSFQAWIIDLSSGKLPPIGALLANLDSTELERYERLKPEHAKRRFVAAHAAMRAILVKRLNTSPGRIKFKSDERGKPQLLSFALEFNLSHSADWAVLAIAETGPIGVDIELVREIPNLLSMVDFICSPRERVAFDQIESADERLRKFFDLWTRKEAMLKAWGYGLRLDPRTIEASERMSPPDSENGRAPLEITSLALMPQLIGSAATQPGSNSYGAFEFSWEKEAF